MKGVLLAGGYGTRMFPMTQHMNKHMLPVYNKKLGCMPCIYFSIKTLVDSGIKDILIITSPHHLGDISSFLGDGEEFGCDFTYKLQVKKDTKPLGISSALSVAKNFTLEDDFMMILGDNYFDGSFEQAINKHYEKGCECSLFTKFVEEPAAYGVLNDDLNMIAEKPETFIGNMAVTGLYIYNKSVYDVIKTLKPSRRNELEITDVNNYYLKRGSCRTNVLNEFWIDMGTPSSMMRLNEHLKSKSQEI